MKDVYSDHEDRHMNHPGVTLIGNHYQISELVGMNALFDNGISFYGQQNKKNFHQMRIQTVHLTEWARNC